MSRCQLIKNGFYWNAGSPTSFCCADDDLSPRPSFEMQDWEQKRKTEAQLYNDSLNDWLPSCYSCKFNEQYPDGTSMRTNIENTPHMQNVDDDDYSIKEAIIRTSNTCNLACRMCGPEYSSKWSSVLKNNLAYEIEPNTNGVRIPAAKPTEEMTDADMVILKEKVLTPDLRFLLFSGGEVLLSDWNRQILEYLIEKDLCRNIHVHITTNGTLPFKDSWLASLQQFKRSAIEYSIDGTDESFDYIRVGHSYEALLDNIQQTQTALPASPDLHYEFNMVVQAHNAHTAVRDAKRLNELLHSISYRPNEENEKIPRQFKINACITPDYLSVNIFPPALYKKYNLEELLGDQTDNYNYNPRLAEKFFRQSAHMDRAHDTSLEQLNPDFFDSQYYSKEQIDNYKKAYRRVWNYGEKDVT